MRILYVTTTFPAYSETFLQREVRALRALGAELHIISMHGGERSFEGLPVDRFSKWELVNVLWRLPWIMCSRWSAFKEWWTTLFTEKPPSALSFWENMLGMGVALLRERRVRVLDPDVVHCVWSGGPGSFGWANSLLVGTPFSVGAHAYDVFDHGGDWLLERKLGESLLIHTSNQTAYEELLKRAPERKVRLIRRGMNRFPDFKPIRSDRSKLRIVCVARLVEKKGFPYQMNVYDAARKAGIEFDARIIGEGKERSRIEADIEERGLENQVKLFGRLSQLETMQHIAWADVLVHTGIIARNGDRDGLPNVIPEAMASGTLVVASPVSGVVEAVFNRETGFLADVSDTRNWLAALRCIQTDDSLCEGIRSRARAWVEKEWVAERNSGKLLEALRESM